MMVRTDFIGQTSYWPYQKLEIRRQRKDLFLLPLFLSCFSCSCLLTVLAPLGGCCGVRGKLGSVGVTWYHGPDLVFGPGGTKQQQLAEVY
ncbi:hypothetical protein AVEN_245268-1 [Araneus ventricosus]|uniref:Uncharacterized protein n=1 Tax=Araneus ventricosus TaxID=182803 RepID=A0A4Y2EFC3_ARAVE|nr:hypothetical protein AVEN_245268-1 [Araneus ventricosus]